VGWVPEEEILQGESTRAGRRAREQISLSTIDITSGKQEAYGDMVECDELVAGHSSTHFFKPRQNQYVPPIVCDRFVHVRSAATRKPIELQDSQRALHQNINFSISTGVALEGQEDDAKYLMSKQSSNNCETIPVNLDSNCVSSKGISTIKKGSLRRGRVIVVKRHLAQYCRQQFQVTCVLLGREHSGYGGTKGLGQ
jgi:hypothetical protein